MSTTGAGTPLLQIQHLTKDYRKGVRANDDISFELEAGHILGLLGHNGAGKTTLLNQVIGLAEPTSGTIRLDGFDAVADPARARKVCSMQPQAQAPLDGLTPRQATELMARIRGADRHRAKERATELFAALDLEQWADTVAEKLSGGVRRLTAFCMAAVEPGRVVMFDEPTNDVDPVRRRLLWSQVRALGEQGAAVVLVTHNVIEAERAVEHLVILDQGKVVAQGTPAQLRGDHSNELRLEIAAIDPATAARLADEIPGRAPAVLAGRRALLTINADEIGAAITWAQQRQADEQIEEFSITPVSLEDVYIRLVGSESDQNGSNGQAGGDHDALVA